MECSELHSSEMNVCEISKELSLSDVSLNNDSNSFEFDISTDTDIKISMRDELIGDLVNLYLHHNLTKTAAEGIAKLVNKVPGAVFKIPSTKFLQFKEFLRKSL